jgi:hypothetical protein
MTTAAWPYGKFASLSRTPPEKRISSIGFETSTIFPRRNGSLMMRLIGSVVPAIVVDRTPEDNVVSVIRR